MVAKTFQNLPRVRENMDRQIIKKQTYCYSCEAKMEAQDGSKD